MAVLVYDQGTSTVRSAPKKLILVTTVDSTETEHISRAGGPEQQAGKLETNLTGWDSARRVPQLGYCPPVGGPSGAGGSRGCDHTGLAHLWHHIPSPSLGSCLTCTNRPVLFSWSLLICICGSGTRSTPTYNVCQVCIILLNPFEFQIRVPLTAPKQLRLNTQRVINTL